jgi:hypothetical protein
MHRLISFAFLAVLATWPVYAQDQTRGRSERVKDRGAHEILIAGRHWDLLGEGYHLTADSTMDKVGNVYFTDARKNRILKIDLDGNINTWREDTNGAHGVAFGPDGRLYAGQHDRKRIVAFSSDGTESVITEGVQSHHLTVTSRNHIYFSVPPTHKVWLVDAAGHRSASLAERHGPPDERFCGSVFQAAPTIPTKLAWPVEKSLVGAEDTQPNTDGESLETLLTELAHRNAQIFAVKARST